MNLWRCHGCSIVNPDLLDWIQSMWPSSTWPRINFLKVSLELRYWNPGIMRRNYRHFRTSGFYRREALLHVVACTLGIWWTSSKTCQRLSGIQR